MKQIQRLVAYAPNGAKLSPIPSPTDYAFSVPLNDLSGCTINYRDMTIGATVFGSPIEVASEYSQDGGVTWTEYPNGRFIRLQRSGQLVGPEKLRGYTLPSYGWQLGKMRQMKTTALNADGKRPFNSANAGTIMKTLLDEAIARGVVPGMTYDFNASVDSNGAAWAKIVNIAYEPGLDLFTILNNLSLQGMCDWFFQGRTLRIFNADSFLAGQKNVKLQPGTDISAMPVAGSYEDMIHTVLVLGDNGKRVTINDATGAPTPWGKWEGFISQGGVTDSATLTLFGNTMMSDSNHEKVQYTAEVNVATSNYEPMVDYRQGDYLDLPGEGGAYSRFRVRALNFSKDAAGKRSLGLIINDRFVEKEIRNARKTNGITGGASAGGAGTKPTPESAVPRKPATPSNLVGSSSVAPDAQGNLKGQLIIDFPDVSTDVDGAALEVPRYQARAAVAGESPLKWQSWGSYSDSVIVRNNLDPGSTWTVQVLARGEAGRLSDWSTATNFTVTTDNVPPPKPSTPVLTTAGGTMTIRWNGRGSAGEAYPGDFKSLSVWFYPTGSPSADPAFTFLGRPDLKVVSGVTPGQEYTCFFIAYDNLGNASETSTVATLTAVSAAQDASIQAAIAAVLADATQAGTTAGAAAANGKNSLTYSPMDPVQNDFTALTGITAGGSATNALDTAWFGSSPSSVRCTSTGSNASAVYPHGGVGSGASAAKMGVQLGAGGVGRQYTAKVRAYLAAAQTGSPSSAARRIVVSAVDAGGATLTLSQSDALPNVAGAEATLTTTFAVPAGVTDVYVRLINGSAVAGEYINWDDYVLVPGGPPTVADTWWKRNTSGIILGQWEYDGIQFVSKKVDGAVLANLDAATITVGFMSGQRITAGSIKTNRLAVGVQDNYVVDPLMLDTELNAVRTVNSPAGWAAATGKWVGTNIAGIRVYPTAAGGLPAAGEAVAREGWAVQPGDRILISATVMSTLASQTYLQVRTYGPTGTSLAWQWPASMPVTTVANTAQTLSAIYVVPAGVNWIAPAILFNTPGTYNAEVSSVVYMKQTPSTLIQDGAITTGKIAAEAVTADQIAAGAITAVKITADAIESKTLSLKGSLSVTGTISTNGRVAVSDKPGFYMSNSGYFNVMNADTLRMLTVDPNTGKVTIQNGALVVDGGIITGSAFQTDTGGARTVIGSDGRIRTFLADGTTFLDINPALTSLNMRLVGGARMDSLNLATGGTTIYGIFTATSANLGIDSNGNRDIYLNTGTRYVVGPGIYDNQSTSTYLSCVVNSAGRLGVSASSRRFKVAIKDLDTGKKILGLRPVSFYNRKDSEELADRIERLSAGENLYPENPAEPMDTDPLERGYGVIAEEIEELGLSEFVAYDKDGEVFSVHYDRMWIPLVPIVKEHEETIASLLDRITALEGRLAPSDS